MSLHLTAYNHAADTGLLTLYDWLLSKTSLVFCKTCVGKTQNVLAVKKKKKM